MKDIFVLLVCFLTVSSTAWCQKHEIGVHGGGIIGNPIGKNNSSDVAGGFNAGVYYRYAPIKWIGVQGGVRYQFFNENQGYWFNRNSLKNALEIPLQVIVFPKYRFNLIGGIYMKNLLGRTVTSDEVHNSEQTIEAQMYKMSKKPIFGYEVGVAWNRKNCRIVFSFRQDINSWMDKQDQKSVLQTQGRYFFMKHVPKSMTFNISVEIPLWRFRK